MPPGAPRAAVVSDWILNCAEWLGMAVLAAIFAAGLVGLFVEIPEHRKPDGD